MIYHIIPAVVVATLIAIGHVIKRKSFLYNINR